MALNHQFWRRRFRSNFHRQLELVVHALEARLLPAYENLDDEAERATDEAWEQHMARSGREDCDPSEFAESARDAGVDYYLVHNGLRQGLVNFFAAALYHAFEQQLMSFLRRELLSPQEEHDPKLMTRAILVQRLQRHGIEVSSFSAWEFVVELELVANTVKHGQGRSSRDLHARRPDYFQPPDSQFAPSMGEPRVYQPLFGEDLFVQLGDLRRYRDELICFWQQLADAMSIA
jgi:hypothetical protein